MTARQSLGVLAAAAMVTGALAATEIAGRDVAQSPPRTVRSADGGLVVSIPRGAMKKVAPVRIRVLKPSRYPSEFRGATFRPGSKIYALEPDGQRFSKPVAITRRIDAEVAGFAAQEGLPAIYLATRDRRGKWGLLAGHSVRRTGKTLVIRATTRHFSTLVALDDLVRLTVAPDAVELPVGGNFQAKVEATATSDLNDIRVETPSWHVTDDRVLRKDGQETKGRVATADFTCVKQGSSSWSAAIEVTDVALTSAVVYALTRGERTISWKFVISGSVACRGGGVPSIGVVNACVVTVHQALQSFPSYLRWLFGFAAGSLPQAPRVEVTAAGVNGGQPVSAAVDASTGRAEVRGGISSFGAKQIQKVAVNGQDVTSQVVAKLGTSSPTVTSSEGTIAGTCPS